MNLGLQGRGKQSSMLVVRTVNEHEKGGIMALSNNDKDLENKRDTATDKTVDTPDTTAPEGRDDINSADGSSPENVVSNTSKRIRDEKHGRSHGEPITGANPKTV